MDSLGNSSTSGKVKLHISNIPYEMKWQELKDLLREKVGADVYVEIFSGPDGRPSGVGFIEVRSAELARKTVEVMHRSDIRGRQIIVREENEEDVMRRIQMSAIGSAMGPTGARSVPGPHQHSMQTALPPQLPPGGPQSMTMLNSAPAAISANADFGLQFLTELGIDPTNITNQVFVANLDYKVSAEMLEEVFRIAGNVLAVELKMDKDNKFRGMATVRFEHPMESVQAISLFNGQRYHGRSMSVRMDRWNDPKPQIVPKMLPMGLESVGMGLGLGGRPLYNLGQISNTLTLANLSSFLRNKTLAGNGVSGPMQRGYGGGTVPPAVDAANLVGGLGNLETIIAATIRAVTGQMGSLGSPTDGSGGLVRTNMGPGPGAMGMAGSNIDMGPAGYGSQAAGLGLGRWPGSSAVNMQSTGSALSNVDDNTLYVGNLPFSYTWQSLKDRFKEVGEVLFADIKMENGRSAGYGTVRMKTSDDAANAISKLNGALIDGRQIEVGWYRKCPMAPSSYSKPGFV